YRTDDAGRARLVAATGLPAGHPAAPEVLGLGPDVAWPLGTASTGPQLVHDLRSRFDHLPTSVWDDPPRTAAVVPLVQQGQAAPTGYLIAGLNPYRPIDEGYLGFLQLFAGLVDAATTNVRALAAERE